MKRLSDIPSFEQFSNYAVTEDGRVYSHITSKFLKTTLRKGNGLTYEVITLRGKDKIRRKFSIHRLVCLAFNFNKEHANLSVNHKDENPLNNHISNLEWMSVGDNIRYSQKDLSYLGDPDELTKEFNDGDWTVKQFADKYNAPLNTMWDVLNKMGKVQNKKKRRVFSREVKNEIFREKQSGKTIAEVARMFNCSNSMVSKVCKELQTGRE